MCWTIGRANGAFVGDGLLVKDLMAHFGLTGSPSQRASTLLEAGGFADRDPDNLGSPDYLVSARRRGIMDLRDRLRAEQM